MKKTSKVPDYPTELRKKVEQVISLDKNIARERALLSSLLRIEDLPPPAEYRDNLIKTINKKIERLNSIFNEEK